MACLDVAHDLGFFLWQRNASRWSFCYPWLTNTVMKPGCRNCVLAQLTLTVSGSYVGIVACQVWICLQAVRSTQPPSLSIKPVS